MRKLKREVLNGLAVKICTREVNLDVEEKIRKLGVCGLEKLGKRMGLKMIGLR